MPCVQVPREPETLAYLLLHQRRRHPQAERHSAAEDEPRLRPVAHEGLLYLLDEGNVEEAALQHLPANSVGHEHCHEHEAGDGEEQHGVGQLRVAPTHGSLHVHGADDEERGEGEDAHHDVQRLVLLGPHGLAQEVCREAKCDVHEPRAHGGEVEQRRRQTGGGIRLTQHELVVPRPQARVPEGVGGVHPDDPADERDRAPED
mmetsp:Transcript_23296/g.63131  ORF Transcript_23296/g.63131 Transcript_23296/m.63131 type:complete len:203 (+) Transcript_23296:1606-2214(+)